SAVSCPSRGASAWTSARLGASPPSTWSRTRCPGSRPRTRTGGTSCRGRGIISTSSCGASSGPPRPACSGELPRARRGARMPRSRAAPARRVRSEGDGVQRWRRRSTIFGGAAAAGQDDSGRSWASVPLAPPSAAAASRLG
ncbi:unnamed protein product, partial [Prorocentrum cordatum]